MKCQKKCNLVKCYVATVLFPLAVLGYSQLANAGCTGNGYNIATSPTTGLVLNNGSSPPAGVPLAPLPGITTMHGFSCDGTGYPYQGDRVRIDLTPVLSQLSTIINPADGKSYGLYQINDQFGLIMQALGPDRYPAPVTVQPGVMYSGVNNLLQSNLNYSSVITHGSAAIVPLVSLGPGTYTIPKTTVSSAKTYVNDVLRPDGNSTSAINGTTFYVRAHTCSITSVSEVVLPDVKFDEFKGVGTLAKATNVPITVTCQAFGGPQIILRWLITDALTPSNRTNRLTPGPTDTSNVQVALYRNNTSTPANLAPESDTASSYVLGTIPSGGGVVQQTIPLVAAYYATVAKSTAGKVTGKATLTLVYQ